VRVRPETGTGREPRRELWKYSNQLRHSLAISLSRKLNFVHGFFEFTARNIPRRKNDHQSPNGLRGEGGALRIMGRVAEWPLTIDEDDFPFQANHITVGPPVLLMRNADAQENRRRQ